jgi:tetratricopeptide (TPR) repeat protein
MMTSKNFSFRSANLRHLGRLIEARHSAELALELDATNSDAHYNLAKLLLQMGRRAEAEKHARRTLEGDAGAYAARLRPLFPDLVAAERREGGP